jgi:hypothetical protein
MNGQLRPGDRVRLSTPRNPRLDGAAAVVKEMTAWGAVVATAAAGSGEYRALFSEMVPAAGGVPTPTGNVCQRCGSPDMRRAGACEVCGTCGESSGCG